MISSLDVVETWLDSLIGGTIGLLLQTDAAWVVGDRADCIRALLEEPGVGARVHIARVAWNRLPATVNTPAPAPVAPEVLAILEPEGVAIALEVLEDGALRWATLASDDDPDDGEDGADDPEEDDAPTLPPNTVKVMRNVAKFPTAASTYVGLLSLLGAGEETSTETLVAWTTRSASAVKRGLAKLLDIGAVRRAPRPGRRTAYLVDRFWAGPVSTPRRRGGSRR